LLPKAEAVAEDDSMDFRFEVNPAVLYASMPFAHRDNLAGVDVFQDENGKWIADIVLKQVPVGIGSRVGTHADHAHDTRQEAVEAAVHMLAHILRTKPSDEIRDPVFVFFDRAFSVPRKIIEEMAQVPRVEPEYLAQRLLRVGKYVTRLDTLTEDEQREWDVTIIMALINDIIKWPPSVAGEALTQERLAAMPLDELAKLTQYRFGF
jgi:hypothetical protein